MESAAQTVTLLPELSTNRLPIKLEKEKAEEERRKVTSKTGKFTSQETITALRQNLSQPGKVITALLPDNNNPYPGVSEILMIADSANNRYLILNAETHEFIEQIGSGRVGYKEGGFKDA